MEQQLGDVLPADCQNTGSNPCRDFLAQWIRKWVEIGNQNFQAKIGRLKEQTQNCDKSYWSAQRLHTLRHFELLAQKSETENKNGLISKSALLKSFENMWFRCYYFRELKPMEK